MRLLFVEHRLFYVLILGLTVFSAMSADPNTGATDPNAMLFNPMLQHPDPNMSLQPPLNPTPGKLATNWLFQGKKPPKPLVGQDDITIRTGFYPWPYIGYHQDDFVDWPWLYHPWYRYGYWGHYPYDYWRYYSCDHGRHYWHDYGWGQMNDYTYPLNYVDVQIKLNENTSLHFGASFFCDPVAWP